ncbi:CoA transferase [Hyphomicrobium sp.]|uniref:CaiB/BaiF CoA-transferase family protein n=1 Tax=Hyphomicrobium sp. TaxID=82 RepID=UPI001D55AD17|nr:CoA transferase [Hyphomicrobium sp.]MBY0558801.1 CoA transferase [Hyphomicrobium sp.]
MNVLSLDGRLAVTLCGQLLRKAGAKVYPEDCAQFAGPYDVVLFSSDENDAAAIAAEHCSAVLCDIATGFGPNSDGPSLSDAEIQALFGLTDVTGFAEHGATATQIPVVEISAALYAAALISASRLAGKPPRRIGVSLVATAVAMLTTFLPKAFLGHRSGRVGNRHTAAAPWNGYPTRDGHVLICTTTDAQWARLRETIGDSALEDPRFATSPDRIAAVDALDALIAKWTASLATSKCVAVCEAIQIPAGPIVAPEDLWREPNFAFRHPEAAAKLEASVSGSAVAANVDLFRLSFLNGGAAQIPRRTGTATQPLSGWKVIELGQFTAVPLATRHLASLGATIVKVEAPSGETSRRWQPGMDGTSYYFAQTNAGKRCERLDLTAHEGKTRLEELISDAHILVENMRPGSLEKLGFGVERLARINPNLLYCSVSGFGLATAYPGRPAFDTVIQAMSGAMVATPSSRGPVKLGISAADILGAQVTLFAILAGVWSTNRLVDVAMQDVTAWAALLAGEGEGNAGYLLEVLDGPIWIADESIVDEAELLFVTTLPRAHAACRLRSAGNRVQPVRRVDELLFDPAFQRDMILTASDEDGRGWPLLHPPYRINGVDFPPPSLPPRVDRMSLYGPLDSAPTRETVLPDGRRHSHGSNI